MNLRMQQDQGNRRFQDGYAGIRLNRACYAAIQTHETDERAWTYYIQSRSDLLYKVPETWSQLRSGVLVE
ncbi:hypothetical protein QP794_23070 [Paenibacillus sp. UMB7766-LJ446]|uniref:hypothetical protein n=1 Tax=Paenibacillus sp. UMB7766-LJ446 TaxID=3046313 RepID=UPI00254AD868|nr:hypothetical protein [Paenibacillus sp. UMB7766-LJ446]MDK8192974.1 hypothetical protein [Paenibacillus sp. UMB7766-LJ446]